MLQTQFSSDTDLNVHLRQRQHHGTEAFQYRRADGGRDISVPFLGYPHKHLQGVRSMHAQREARATGGGGARDGVTEDFNTSGRKVSTTCLYTWYTVHVKYTFSFIQQTISGDHPPVRSRYLVEVTP